MEFETPEDNLASMKKEIEKIELEMEKAMVIPKSCFSEGKATKTAREIKGIEDLWLKRMG